MSAQDDDFLGPEFDQEKSGTADNLTPKQTHVFDWDKSIILDDIDEKPEAAINANSSSKDQYCVLSGELTPSAYKVHIFWEGHKILRNLPPTFDQ